MLVEKRAQAKLPTMYGVFDMIVFEELSNGKEHVALVMGDIGNGERVLSRIHSECLTGDVFHSLKCDCGFQLHMAMQNIADEGRGVLIYHREEGRGIGLTNKVRAYALQDQGMDTVEANEALGFPADMRNFSCCADIYALLGVQSIELMTNNPRKMETMRKFGINVVDRRPIVVGKNQYNENYLRTKTAKLQHMFTQEQLNRENLEVNFDGSLSGDFGMPETPTSHEHGTNCTCGNHEVDIAKDK